MEWIAPIILGLLALGMILALLEGRGKETFLSHDLDLDPGQGGEAAREALRAQEALTRSAHTVPPHGHQ